MVVGSGVGVSRVGNDADADGDFTRIGRGLDRDNVLCLYVGFYSLGLWCMGNGCCVCAYRVGGHLLSLARRSEGGKDILELGYQCIPLVQQCMGPCIFYDR